MLAARGWPESDASGDDAVEFIGAGVSSHPETGAYDCRFGGVSGNSISAFGGGAAIPFEIDAGVNSPG